METEKYLERNGTDLTHVDGKVWLCIKTHSDSASFKVARRLMKNNITYFLPYYYDLKNRVRGLFPGYIFCRVLMNKVRTFNKFGKVLKIEGPKSEHKLLSELKEFSKHLSLKKNYTKGEEIEVISGSLQGIKGPIIEINDSIHSIKVGLKFFNRDFGAWVSKQDVVLKEQKERFEFLIGETDTSESIPPMGEEFYEDEDDYSSYKAKETLQEEIIQRELDISISEINKELIKYLAKHPHKMHDLTPRKFEVLIAELLRDMGYDVMLTPETRDGGRDIFAVIKVPPGKEILTIVECKKYSANNTIGVDIVERFLWIVERKDKANGGLIATTSFFSDQALKLQKDFAWMLSLYNFDHLNGWLKNYGNWQQKDDEVGIWLPSTFKP